MVEKPGPAIVAIVADLHFNSTVALCPPRVERDDMGVYLASKAQRWLWQCWRKAWAIIGDLKKQHQARVIAVVAGDVVDNNRHTAHQLITVNKGDIIRGGAATLAPMLEVADTTIIIRGTEAHSGGCGELEELVAHRIDAEPDIVTGSASWWFWRAEVEGVTFDVAHHPITSARRPWTMGASAARHSAIVRDHYYQSGEKPPDYCFRAHVHYSEASGSLSKPMFAYCHPWQLSTAYSYRLGANGYIEPPGIYWVICRDGQHTFDWHQFKPKRSRVWRG